MESWHGPCWSSLLRHSGCWTIDVAPRSSATRHDRVLPGSSSCFGSSVTTTCRTLGAGGDAARPKQERCYSSIGALLTWELQPWLRAQFLAPHLKVILEIFSTRRLLILHQASLRRTPRETYDHAARWLGARSGFSAAYRFRRRQYRLGHRTDLCHNVSLQEALKRRLVLEYGTFLWAISLQAGAGFPQREAQAELEEHRSRCDDPEDRGKRKGQRSQRDRKEWI
ncbi:unnamed protein product [Durusdinium trenchii]|uniref:Uncharacterized protein n=1 Tax=Durusdinium trenchii TaxID=1381693 RepID=A0ABP0ICF8_9DINO